MTPITFISTSIVTQNAIVTMETFNYTVVDNDSQYLKHHLALKWSVGVGWFVVFLVFVFFVFVFVFVFANISASRDNCTEIGFIFNLLFNVICFDTIRNGNTIRDFRVTYPLWIWLFKWRNCRAYLTPAL